MIFVPPTEEGLQLAVQALQSNEIIAYPTETVYGLGANPFSEIALEKLWAIKDRPQSNPILIIIAEPEDVYEICEEVSEKAKQCIELFWPGPLSLLLPHKKIFPNILTAGKDKLCVRCPSNEIARNLCRNFGGPITSTSANLTGQPPALNIRETNLEGVFLAIDAGIIHSSKVSTIFDPDKAQIIREGAISKKQLAKYHLI